MLQHTLTISFVTKKTTVSRFIIIVIADADCYDINIWHCVRVSKVANSMRGKLYGEILVSRSKIISQKL